MEKDKKKKEKRDERVSLVPHPPPLSPTPSTVTVQACTFYSVSHNPGSRSSPKDEVVHDLALGLLEVALTFIIRGHWW